MNEALDYVRAVHLFPVKSCQEATENGKVITELQAGPTGLCYGQYGEAVDRGWVVADPDGLFVSQRGWDGKKARKYRDDRLLATVAIDLKADYMNISAPNHGSVVIPFEVADGKKDSIHIFGPDLPVIAESEDSGDFFSSLLGRSVSLWRSDVMKPRLLPEKYQRPMAANRSAGADGRPISLASQASLDYLHDLADLPRGTVPLINFRANVDIEGLDLGPFGEDRLRQIRMGNIAAYVVKALARCPMPNFDQTTGDDSLRLATKIMRARLGWALGEDTSKKAEPFFAQSLNHHFIPGFRRTVRAGDMLTATESGDPNVILKSSAA